MNFGAYPPKALVGANFDGAKLQGANFSGQDLSSATFRNAILGSSSQGPAVFTNTNLDHTCFAGATLNDARFEYAKIRCADFSNTDMLGAQFGPRQSIAHAGDCRTRFIKTKLDPHAVTPDHWSFTDFTDAKFQNYSPATFSLTGRDLTGAMLARTVLPGIDLSKSNLTAADLQGTQLAGASLEDATLNGAKLTGVNLGGARLRCARFWGSKGDANENPNVICQSNPESSQLRAAADLTSAQLRGARLDSATLNYAQLRGAILDRASAKHASFMNASFIADTPWASASFEGADLSESIFKDAHLQQISFDGTILEGADFSGTTLQGTSFESAIAPGAKFSNATLEHVNFKYAALQSASFTNATLQTGPDNTAEVIFTCAHLEGSDFSGADVKEARFTAAVMPTSDCCGTIDAPTCGTDPFTGLTYAKTKVPQLSPTNVQVTCPNGSPAPCTPNWDLPAWKTNLCNASSLDHSDRVMWVKPDCSISPSGPTVTFSDANLETCVRGALGVTTPVTKGLAPTLTELRCAGRGITSLGGLDAFTNLRVLDLSDNALTGFAVSLPMLRELNVSNNQLGSMQVATLKVLVRLLAANNHLQSLNDLPDISPQILDLSHNNLSNVDVAIQDQLLFANLSANQLTRITDSDNPDLSRARNLSYLDVSNNALTTIGPLQPSLSSIVLNCNASFTCATLGSDPTSPVMQQSGCVVANTQGGTTTWQLLTNPRCP